MGLTAGSSAPEIHPHHGLLGTRAPSPSSSHAPTHTTAPLPGLSPLGQAGGRWAAVGQGGMGMRHCHTAPGRDRRLDTSTQWDSAWGTHWAPAGTKQKGGPRVFLPSVGIN